MGTPLKSLNHYRSLKQPKGLVKFIPLATGSLKPLNLIPAEAIKATD